MKDLFPVALPSLFCFCLSRALHSLKKIIEFKIFLRMYFSLMSLPQVRMRVFERNVGVHILRL